MNHAFGLVLSQRSSQALRIDPVLVDTCNWNYVYCQLGSSMPFMDERRDFFSCEELESSGRDQVIKRYGCLVWSAAWTRYPDEARSQTVTLGRREHSHRGI
jgi:wyosine [tRNA(Phe)-imidazoG37] synthetase (radical SAM superfamily)